VVSEAPWPPLLLAATEGVPDVRGLRCDAIHHADGSLYLERHHIVEGATVNVRVHHWHSGDDQRAPHDHPWPNASVLLAGELIEHDERGVHELHPGDIVTRRADEPHRIELVSPDAWTLFFTGPVERRWGFHTPDGWVHWREWPWAGYYVEVEVAAEAPPSSRQW